MSDWMQRVGARARGAILPSVLSIYLIAVLWFAIRLIFPAWPGNPYVEPYFAKEQERLAILEVTKKKIEELDQAVTILASLAANSSAGTLSAKQLDLLAAEIVAADGYLRSRPFFDKDSLNTPQWIAVKAAFIDSRLQALNAEEEKTSEQIEKDRKEYEILRSGTNKLVSGKSALVTGGEWQKIDSALRLGGLVRSKSPPSLSPSPVGWSSADYATALKEYLIPARQMLQERSQQLRTPQPPLGLSDVIWGLPEVHDTIVFPPLSSTEEAEIARLRLDSLREGKASLRAGQDPDGKVRNQQDLPASAWRVAHLFGSAELELFTLFACFGAIGAAVCGLASLASFLGTRKFDSVWFLFYLTRPFIGAALGPLFYVVLRGGLFGQNASWTDVNVFGYSAVAALVGFSATEAMENLRAVATSFFRRKVSPPVAPVLNQAVVLDAEWIELRGKHFEPTALVLFNRLQIAIEEVTFISEESIRVRRRAIPEGAVLLVARVINLGAKAGISQERQVEGLN